MAFNRDNLVRLGGANSNGKAFWMYSSSTDAYGTIDNADYFLSAINELKLDDSILVCDSTSVHKLTYVATNDGSTISIAAGVTVTA